MAQTERYRLDREAAEAAMQGIVTAPHKAPKLEQFLWKLHQCRGFLPRQLIKTLRGQALAGDLMGAEKGLAKSLKL